MSSKKRRITNKKNTKLTYDQRLVRPENNDNTRLKLAQSDNPEDKEKLKSQRGRKSLAEKAVEKGKFEEITEAIKYWVELNPYYNQAELETFLKSEYKDVFGEKVKYPQSFYRALENVDEWREALKPPVEERLITQREALRFLNKRLRQGVREEIDSKGKIYEIGITDKSVMDYIRLLHDMEQWEKEAKAIKDKKNKGSITVELSIQAEELDIELEEAIAEAGDNSED